MDSRELAGSLDKMDKLYRYFEKKYGPYKADRICTKLSKKYSLNFDDMSFTQLLSKGEVIAGEIE